MEKKQDFSTAGRQIDARWRSWNTKLGRTFYRMKALAYFVQKLLETAILPI